MNDIFSQRERHIKYAQSIVLSKSDAEDIVQDCYEKVIKKLDYFSEQVKHQNTYFFTILRNGCLDFLRKGKGELEVEVDSVIEANYNTPESILETKFALNRLERLMQKLPEKQRTVFYLRDIEGYELEEISKIVDIRNDAVRANLSRARKKIKSLYQTQLQ